MRTQLSRSGFKATSSHYAVFTRSKKDTRLKVAAFIKTLVCELPCFCHRTMLDTCMCILHTREARVMGGWSSAKSKGPGGGVEEMPLGVQSVGYLVGTPAPGHAGVVIGCEVVEIIWGVLRCINATATRGGSTGQ